MCANFFERSWLPKEDGVVLTQSCVGIAGEDKEFIGLIKKTHVDVAINHVRKWLRTNRSRFEGVEIDDDNDKTDPTYQAILEFRKKLMEIKDISVTQLDVSGIEEENDDDDEHEESDHVVPKFPALFSNTALADCPGLQDQVVMNAKGLCARVDQAREVGLKEVVRLAVRSFDGSNNHLEIACEKLCVQISSGKILEKSREEVEADSTGFEVEAAYATLFTDTDLTGDQIGFLELAAEQLMTDNERAKKMGMETLMKHIAKKFKSMRQKQANTELTVQELCTAIISGKILPRK